LGDRDLARGRNLGSDQVEALALLSPPPPPQILMPSAVQQLPLRIKHSFLKGSSLRSRIF